MIGGFVGLNVLIGLFGSIRPAPFEYRIAQIPKVCRQLLSSSSGTTSDH